MSAGTIAVSVVVGVATGVISSFAVWWWLSRRLQPNLYICPTLADFISTDGGTRTQFRILNRGRRDAFDLSVKASLRLPSLISPGVTEVALLRQEYVSALPVGSSRRWGLNLARSQELEIYWKHMPKGICERRDAGLKIRVGDLLAAVPGATLHIGVFGTDAFSGTRSYVEQSYSSAEVVSGRFLGDGCRHANSSDYLPGDIAKPPDVRVPRDHDSEDLP